jgi:hypothetical protein
LDMPAIGTMLPELLRPLSPQLSSLDFTRAWLTGSIRATSSVMRGTGVHVGKAGGR